MPPLRYIIRHLLIEGRLEDAQKKYPKVDVNALAVDDPSGRAAKYLMWMAKQADAGASPVDVISTIQVFHSNPRKFQYQDINRYTAKQLEDEWKELEAAGEADTVSASELRRLAKSGAVEIYRDDEHIVHRIRDKAAAQAYGKGTKWCITMSTGNYFESYDNQNVVFYFAVRLKPLGDDMDKIAYAIMRSNSNTITGTEVYDAADHKIWGGDPDVGNDEYYDTGDVSTSPFDRPELLRDAEDAIYADIETVPKSFGADVRSGTVASERIKEEFKKCTDAKSQLSFLCSYKLSDELYVALLPTIVDDDIHAIVNDLASGLAESDGRNQIMYRNNRRQLHRLNGPAKINQNGHMEWHVHGLRHREDGPAIVYTDGNKEWYINGKMHRLDGPALDWGNVQQWYINGKRHRLDGPAKIVSYKPDANEWWVDGVEYTEAGHADAVARYNAKHAT